MKRRLITLLPLLALLALAGCRTQRQQPTPPPAPAPTVEAAFSCSVEGISASGMLRMQQDSVIWVSVNKLIELGRARVTRDSLVAYIPPTNQYLRMDMGEARRRFKVDYDGLQRLLLESDFRELTVQLPPLTRPATARFTRVERGKRLTFPLQIPASATPFHL